jgi:hypothetical protein
MAWDVYVSDYDNLDIKCEYLVSQSGLMFVEFQPLQVRVLARCSRDRHADV